MTNPFDPDTPHNTARVLALYEWLRPEMPPVRAAERHHAPRLRDLLGEFDALLLDGYGVLNVGAEMVPGADLLLAEAACRCRRHCRHQQAARKHGDRCQIP